MSSFPPLALNHDLFSDRFSEFFCRNFARAVLPEGEDAFLIVSLYGLGDTYLLCAHAERMKEIHCRNGEKLVVAVKNSHRGVAELFVDHIDTIHVLDDEIVHKTIGHLMGQGIKCAFEKNSALFVHPHHMNDTRVDDFTNLDGVSQAHMYANLLRIPINSPLTLAKVSSRRAIEAEGRCWENGFAKGRSVVLFPESNSWPQLPDEFWHHVSKRLSEAGWVVFTNAAGNNNRGRRSDPLPGTRLANIPLELAIPMLEYAGWVVGSLSGFMGVLISSRAKCKKTVVVRGPATGAKLAFNEYIKVSSAFPYGYQRKFDGQDYDIEEIQVRDDADFDAMAVRIGLGFNADHATRPSADPVKRIMTQLAPGELADRITVLEVKLEKLPKKAHSRVLGELEILTETLKGSMHENFELLERKMTQLRDLNREGWEANEIIYGTFDDPEFGVGSWTLDRNNADVVQKSNAVIKAFRASQLANRRRIVIKNEINRMFNSDWLEKKSFDA